MFNLDEILKYLPLLALCIIVGKNLQIITEVKKDLEQVYANIQALEESQRTLDGKMIRIWVRLGIHLEQEKEKNDLHDFLDGGEHYD